MILVGLTGRSGAGKDMAAARLTQRWAFTRVAFGDALKDEVGHLLRRTLTAYIEQVYPGEISTQYGGAADRAVHDRLWYRRDPVVRALMQEAS